MCQRSTLNDEARDLRYFPLDALPANAFVEHAARIHGAICCATKRPVLRIPGWLAAMGKIRLRLYG